MPWIQITLAAMPFLGAPIEGAVLAAQQIAFNPISLLPLSAALLSVLMVAIVMSQEKVRLVHRMFLWLNVSAFIWTFLYFLRINLALWIEPAYAGYRSLFWLAHLATFVGISLVPTYWFLFTAAYYRKTEWTRGWKRAILYLPIVWCALTMPTNSMHHQFFPTWEPGAPGGPGSWTFGAFFWVHVVISYSLILWPIKWHIDASRNPRETAYRRQAAMMAVAAALPLLGNLSWVTQYISGIRLALDPTPMLFAVSNAVFAYALLRMNWLSIFPVALREVFHSMSDAVVVVDGDDRVIQANPAALRVFPRVEPGSPLETLTSDPARRLESGRPSEQKEFELDIGDSIYWGRRIALLDQQKIEGSLFILTEITERKRNEEALRESEERFRSLVQHFSDVITILESDGAIRYGSPSVESVLGYKPEDLSGRNFFDFFGLDPAQPIVGAFKNVVENSGEMSVEVSLRHSDGSSRTLEVTGANLLHHPAVSGIVLNCRDLTERKLLQQQLVQSEKLAAMGQLISGVAHELNNPLTAVIGYTQLLLENNSLDAQARRQLEVVGSQAERTRRIVQNLLAFSRQHKPAHSEVNLNELLEQTLELRAYEMKVNGISVIRDLQPLPVIFADGHQVQQVFLNTIINAEQAMAGNGGGTLTVKSETRLTEGRMWARMSIADDGPGINPEDLGRVFDPFFTTKPIGEGTGLGLSISYGIIKEHGGTIRVESGREPGATFVIELPAQ
ncbi:MAG TPA: histidine kinase N-terminal 7TM domain-containing protein [Blastocatellia bacterium]|nr:histidine kinase N-terminal 7TM domain-containing protein [Blastocatellia bacterium]